MDGVGLKGIAFAKDQSFAPPPHVRVVHHLDPCVLAMWHGKSLAKNRHPSKV